MNCQHPGCDEETDSSAKKIASYCAEHRKRAWISWRQRNTRTLRSCAQPGGRPKPLLPRVRMM